MLTPAIQILYEHASNYITVTMSHIRWGDLASCIHPRAVAIENVDDEPAADVERGQQAIHYLHVDMINGAL